MLACTIKHNSWLEVFRKTGNLGKYLYLGPEDDDDDDDDDDNNNNNNNNNNSFIVIWLLPGGSGYFTCIQNMKLVTT